MSSLLSRSISLCLSSKLLFQFSLLSSLEFVLACTLRTSLSSLTCQSSCLGRGETLPNLFLLVGGEVRFGVFDQLLLLLSLLRLLYLPLLLLLLRSLLLLRLLFSTLLLLLLSKLLLRLLLLLLSLLRLLLLSLLRLLCLRDQLLLRLLLFPPVLLQESRLLLRLVSRSLRSILNCQVMSLKGNSVANKLRQLLTKWRPGWLGRLQ